MQKTKMNQTQLSFLENKDKNNKHINRNTSESDWGYKSIELDNQEKVEPIKDSMVYSANK